MKSLGKDKLLKIGIGIVAGVILIIVILLLVHACTKKDNTYSDIENKMLSAAKKYYKENENLLTKSTSEELTIDDATLTSLGYLKSLADLVKKENVTCTGKVVITYNNGKYRYTPLLDCGDEYKSQTLASHIISTVDRVYTDDGLYDLNGEYVYRGENVNNHVRFSGHDYRIVKITNDHVVLILDERLDRSVWDDRFNTLRNRKDGINYYYNVANGERSRICVFLHSLYDGDSLFTEDGKVLLAVHDVYVGKRSETMAYNDGSIEKSEVYSNQYIGLLPLYDYINASLDTNCNSAKDKGCSNYNYLNHFDYNWWLQTADSVTTHKAYRVTNYGIIEAITTSSSGLVRPVVYLVKDAIYVKGDGTEDNPYVVK